MFVQILVKYVEIVLARKYLLDEFYKFDTVIYVTELRSV